MSSFQNELTFSCTTPKNSKPSWGGVKGQNKAAKLHFFTFKSFVRVEEESGQVHGRENLIQVKAQQPLEAKTCKAKCITLLIMQI